MSIVGGVRFEIVFTWIVDAEAGAVIVAAGHLGLTGGGFNGVKNPRRFI